MATDILIKRSTTTGAVPTTSDLSTGELAVNTVDKRLFTNNSGTIVEIGTNPSSLTVGAITAASGTVSGNWSVTGTLTVATPSNATDAASKGYVDTAVANVIDAAPGALDTLNELAAAINDDANFATTITTALAGKLALTGGTMTGNIVMGANKVTSTATPTADDDLTRKAYVDSILGSATSAAASASAAATSETNAATSASNASTSETNAASSASTASSAATTATTAATTATNAASSASTYATTASTAATNAANSYDSFDDRYLGVKASAPTLDNDGEALLTGALYFNSTNDTMYVYDGASWNTVAPVATSVTESQISDLGTTVAMLANDQTFTGSQRGTVVDNSASLSFDMSSGNNFKTTPTATGAITFTNITSGQSGNIYLNNSTPVVISAASSTYIASADLTTINTAGAYWLSYYSPDGTNVYVSTTPATTAQGL